MNGYVLLAIAIVSEVFGSTMLKMSNGFKRLWPSLGVPLGMGIAFYSLSLALESISLSAAYAIWSGVGTALTAFIGIVFWKESFSLKKLLALILIITGVVILKLAGGDQ